MQTVLPVGSSLAGGRELEEILMPATATVKSESGSEVGTTFREAMSLMTSSVTVIAARRPGGLRCGMTATAVCSLSMDPPSLVLCVNKSTKTLEVIEAAGLFSVNLLDENQEHVANAFARHADNDESAEGKFQHSVWHDHANGAPLLEGSLSCIVCREKSRTDAGTHWIIVGEVEDVVNDGTRRSLLYGSRKYQRVTG